MQVDLHSHVYPAHKAPEVIANLVASSKEMCPVDPKGDGTLEDLLRQEKEDGFDRVAVCPIAVRPEQFNYMVKYLTALRNGQLGEAARERVIPCASLHPRDPELVAHLVALKGLGVRMLKVHPYFQDAALDSVEMLRLLREATAAGVPVLCHTGRDISSNGWADMATPRQVLRAYNEIADLRMICAHCCAWRCPEAEELLLGQRIYVDLAFQPNGGSGPVMRRFATEHPQEYVFFGSDWPWARPAEHAARIRAWGLSEERDRAIFGGNAVRLLGLDI